MRVFQNSWNGKTWKKPHDAAFMAANLVLYFGCRHLMENAAHFQELRTLYPTALIVGCSSGGEIFGTDVDDETLTVSAIVLEKTAIKLSKASVVDSSNSKAAGQALAFDLNKPDLKSVLVFSDGTKVNGSELAKGIQEHLPNISVSGGLAGDGDRFQKTLVCANAAPEEGIIAAIGFYGNAFEVKHGSFGGWDHFGPERRITKSKGNVLYELDGKPALALYKEYLGEEAENLPASALLFPLTIFKESKSKGSLVRTILGINEEDQSMTFAGDVPEGYIAQLMRGDMDHLVDGAAKAAEASHLNHMADSKHDQLSILVSCIGRKLLLGQHTADEVEAVADILSQCRNLTGFYSYGELSPHKESNFCELHNQTMTITTFCEKAS